MPPVVAVDHVHVLVPDRAAAQVWYEQVLALRPVQRLASWATPGGPLMVSDALGNVMLALFEEEPLPVRSTIAFRVGAEAFLEWKEHLRRVLASSPRLSDHQISWSLYFEDPFGNPYEITTYEYDWISDALHP